MAHRGIRSTVAALLIAALAGTATPVTAADATSGATREAPKAPPSYLFVISSTSGSISGVKKVANGQRLTLTLKGVNVLATQFTDRPYRDAYVIATPELVRRWQTWFADSAPNAVLSFLRANDALPRHKVFTLQRPVYNKAARTLSFTATYIPRDADPSPEAQERVSVPNIPLPKTFTSGTLFIDNAPDIRVVNGCAIDMFAYCVNVDFTGVDLTGAYMYGTYMPDAKLVRANLTNANLTGVDLGHADLAGGTFVGTVLTGSRLANSSLVDGNFTNAQMAQVNFESAYIVNANFAGANLAGAVFYLANLTGTSFRGANLAGAYLDRATVTGADFTGANLSGARWTDYRVCATPSIGACL